ncbi:hypothetical protein HJG60_008054 [Phyllostomus discolor]|uniref:Uncharacterized protein n=1 Tax=Phyllostomus discolor TaxID=89673 RepID=A0A834BI48_9CHIR|nr:hypothetical protein HJG60_008054 [Phyllostomus discolor]
MPGWSRWRWSWGAWGVLWLPMASAGAFLQATLPGLAGPWCSPRLRVRATHCREPKTPRVLQTPAVQEWASAHLWCVCVSLCVRVIVDESETYPSSPLRTQTCSKGLSHVPGTSPAGIQDSLAAPRPSRPPVQESDALG